MSLPCKCNTRKQRHIIQQVGRFVLNINDIKLQLPNFAEELMKFNIFKKNDTKTSLSHPKSLLAE